MSEGVQVFTPQCPVLPDGRPRHMFWKVDGKWTCGNCGEAKS